jgi:hypothetical protein
MLIRRIKTDQPRRRAEDPETKVDGRSDEHLQTFHDLAAGLIWANRDERIGASSQRA